MLKRIALLRDRVDSWEAYPFTVPSIQSLESLEIHSRVCCFAGENGSGKSTLLEAIALHYGFGREGGTRSFTNDSTESNHSVDALVRALRLSFDQRSGRGFFLRAETFFNAATYLDDIGGTDSYGGSLHSCSHGESFFRLLDLKFRGNGLFLLDEPEAALSPQRQLSFLVLLHDTLDRYPDAQFILSTHSPLLLGFPGAQIVSFDGGVLHEIAYQDSAPYQIVRRFTAEPASFLEELFRAEAGSAAQAPRPSAKIPE